MVNAILQGNRRFVSVIAGLVLTSSQALGDVDVFDVAANETKTISEDMTITSSTVAGTLKARAQNITIVNLHLGGTADVPAIFDISEFGHPRVTNLTIGENGYPGIVHMYGASWTYPEFYPSCFTIAEGCAPTPGGDTIDIMRLERNEASLGYGLENNASQRARILFGKGGTGIQGQIGIGIKWGVPIFAKGSFVLEGTDGANVIVNQRCPSADSTLSLCAADADVQVRGSCDFKAYSEVGVNRFSIRNVDFENTGCVEFTNLNVIVSGPVRFGSSVSAVVVKGFSDVAGLNLNGLSLTCTVVRTEGQASVRDTSSGQIGRLCFDPAVGDVNSFTGMCQAAVVKTGAGELALGAVAMPSVDVMSGVLRVTSDSAPSSIRLGAGTKLIIDGCAVSSSGVSLDQTAVIETVNGGSLTVDDQAELVHPRLPTGLVKDGEGTLFVRDPSALGKSVWAKSGRIVFSRYGVTDPYYRWTYMDVRPNPKMPNAYHTATINQIWLWDDLGGRVAENGLTSKPNKASPESLGKGEIAFQHDVTYESAQAWHQDPAAIFAPNNNAPYLTAPILDPETGSVVCYVYRLKDGCLPVIGYDLRAGYDTLRVKDWKVETSPDGQNWTLVDLRQDQWFLKSDGVTQYTDLNWANGTTDATTPGTTEVAFPFSGYVSAGVTNMPEVLSVRVDAGATVDFSSVLGGQVVDEIELDVANGGGTVVNAKIAETGIIVFVNIPEGKKLRDLSVPLALDGVSGNTAFKGWKAIVNGKESRATIRYQNGNVTLLPPGLLLVFY